MGNKNKYEKMKKKKVESRQIRIKTEVVSFFCFGIGKTNCLMLKKEK